MAGNKVGLSRIHTQKSCLISTGCLQIHTVFTLSYCPVDQPIIMLLGSTAPPLCSRVYASDPLWARSDGASLTRPVSVLLELTPLRVFSLAEIRALVMLG